ncbi:MAG: lipid II flippase MurJ, partial [Acidimicrobiales bacterium]
ERWAAGDLAGLGERVSTGLRTILAVVVPAGVGLALVSSPLVRTLLLHGRFDAGDARLTSGTLACFALGLPGFSAFLFLTRVWQSMQDTRTTFLLYVAENGANIVLAVVLFRRFGVPGLAAAYGAAYTLASLLTLAVLARRLPSGWLAGTAGFALRLAGATAVLAAAVAATILAVEALRPPGSTRADVPLATAVPVGAAALLAASAALGLSEPLALVQPLLRRLRRRRAG